MAAVDTAGPHRALGRMTRHMEGAPLIRTAAPADRDAIVDVVARAFTSAAHDGQEEVDIVEDTWRLDATLDELELVAVDDTGIVGHVLGARGRPGSPDLVAVAPLCVSPERQRGGVGNSLMTELLERADRQRWRAVVLLGDPAYYGRFGFEPAGALGVVYEPVGAASPHFQIRRLSAFEGDAVRGVFRYCWETSG
jgi:putative acetyltransferase